MTRLYLARHGQTLWNLEGRIQGWGDSPLTELGEKQAGWLAERLTAEGLDVICSSPAGRAVRTAEIVQAKVPVPLRTDPDLRELHFGKYEGRILAEVAQEKPEYLADFRQAPHRFAPDSGETFVSLRDRALRAVTRIIEAYPDGRVLVVAHGGLLQVVMGWAAGIPLERLWEEPHIQAASLSILEWKEGVLSVVLRNDTSHYRNGDS